MAGAVVELIGVASRSGRQFRVLVPELVEPTKSWQTAGTRTELATETRSHPNTNSTTAPPSYTNVPVPMDLDRSRAPPRGGRPMRGRATKAETHKALLGRLQQHGVFPNADRWDTSRTTVLNNAPQAQGRVTEWTEQVHAPDKFPN